MQPVVETDTITVTSSAVQAIGDLLKERNLDGYALRLFVAGKTCSGYQYGMSLDNSVTDTDISISVDTIKVVVDNASIEYLKGAKLDFIDDERGKGFMVDNPNAASSCACDSGGDAGGCGNSGGCCS
jgi:iron-sulfur cluster assembly accessory protein